MNDQRVSFVFGKRGKERLDIFLTGCLPEFSRSRIQGLIKDGFVTVNGDLVVKAGREVEPDQHVEIRNSSANP